MADRGTVGRDGFELEWIREGSGTPLMVLGTHRFYRRYFPQSSRDHFEIAFCDLRQWAPTPDGFDVSTITLDTFSADIDALRQAAGFDLPIVAGQSQHGALALAYGERFPQQVRGVAAIAPLHPRGTRSGSRVGTNSSAVTPTPIDWRRMSETRPGRLRQWKRPRTSSGHTSPTVLGAGLTRPSTARSCGRASA